MLFSFTLITDICVFCPCCRCDGKSKCIVSVDSTSFHDACPGTLKYLEIHYACLSRSPGVIPSDATGNGNDKPKLPPWLIENAQSSSVNTGLNNGNNNRRPENRPGPRKPKGPSALNENPSKATTNNGNAADVAGGDKPIPILVTQRVTIDSDDGRRVPITTPRPTTSKTTTTTTTSSTTSKTITELIDVEDDNINNENNGEEGGSDTRTGIKPPKFPPSTNGNDFSNQPSKPSNRPSFIPGNNALLTYSNKC